MQPKGKLVATITHKPGHPLADKTGWVDKEKYMAYEAEKYAMENSHLWYTDGNRVVTFNYISDHMPDTRHMATNKIHSSKSTFRRDTKQSGCIEVGNEASTMFKPRKRVELSKRQRVDDIRRSIHELKNGRNIMNEIKSGK